MRVEVEALAHWEPPYPLFPDLERSQDGDLGQRCGSMSGELNLTLTPVGSVPEEVSKCGHQRFPVLGAVGFGDGPSQVLMR